MAEITESKLKKMIEDAVKEATKTMPSKLDVKDDRTEIDDDEIERIRKQIEVTPPEKKEPYICPHCEYQGTFAFKHCPSCGKEVGWD